MAALVSVTGDGQPLAAIVRVTEGLLSPRGLLSWWWLPLSSLLSLAIWPEAALD